MAASPIPDLDFFENYEEAVLIASADDLPLFVNRSFANLSGFPKHDLSAVIPSKLFSRKINPGDAKPGTNAHWECSMIKGDGTSVSVNVSVSNIRLSDQPAGKVYTITAPRLNQLLSNSHPDSQLSGVASDEIKNDLASLSKELARSKEELEQFAYVASHDLNEPLRMITGYIQLIQKSVEKGQTKDLNEFMAFVMDGTTRMQALLHDLLLFSRVNRDGNPFAAVDMNEVVKVSMARLKDRIMTSGATVTFDPLPKVQGDISQLLQLISHLLDNAVKFKSPDRKPEVKISVEDSGPDYLFTVQDNGIGIEKKFFERIFIIFQRLHSRVDYGGTGLGLAMCKRIAGRHGGDIWLDSEPGKGSRFHFTLKK